MRMLNKARVPTHVNIGVFISALVFTSVTGFAQRALVDIIVAENIATEFRAKLDRLATDLENDGYTARITSWRAGRSAEDVWNHLKDAYDNDNLQGALFVGHVPVGGEGETDIPYWNMDEYQNTVYYPNSPKHIWVSRFYAPPASSYGDEVSLLSNALDANHYYRTGKSRLTHKAWVHVRDRDDNGAGLASTALDTWKTSEAVDPEGMAEAMFELGGEILDETSHGNNSSYGKGNISISKLHTRGCNIRFILATSCRTAPLGGVANTQNIAAGTKNVLSIGPTQGIWQPGLRLMKSSASSCRARLKAGDSWGKALVASYPFTRQSHEMTIIYGDLSLSSNTTGNQVAPENGIPTVSSSRPVPGRPMVGEPVEFSAVVNDPDSDPLVVEWFMDNKSEHPDKIMTGVAGGTVTFTSSYTETGTVRPYVVVKDPWMTRRRSEELELKVGDPGKRNLKTIVSALDSELMLVAESAEKEALVRLGRSGEDQRHVWDMEPYTHGRFRFRNNENGYGLYRSGFDEGDSVYLHTTIIQWGVDTTGGGLYRIGYMYGHLEDRFLTADNASAETPVRMRARRESDAQLWYIKDYEDDPTQVYGKTTATGNTGSPYLVRHGILFITPSGPGPVSVALFNLHGRKVASVIRNGDRNGTIQIDLRECVATTAVHIAQIEGAGGDRFVKCGLY